MQGLTKERFHVGWVVTDTLYPSSSCLIALHSAWPTVHKAKYFSKSIYLTLVFEGVSPRIKDLSELLKLAPLLILKTLYEALWKKRHVGSKVFKSCSFSVYVKNFQFWKRSVAREPCHLIRRFNQQGFYHSILTMHGPNFFRCHSKW